MPWYRYILPQLLTEITRKPRQSVQVGVDFEWSKKSWTHNLFRIWELIAWRRTGIRKEMSAGFYRGKPWQQPHSFEALCSLTETVIRAWFKKPFGFQIITSPLLATPQGNLPLFYRFAISTDAVANSGITSNNISYAHTCTGSNLGLWTGIDDRASASDNVTAVAYNAVAQTRVNTVAGGPGREYLYFILNPATGAHNVTVTLTSANDSAQSSSYSGVNQSIVYGSTDNQATNTANAASIAVTVTTIADNSWVVAQCSNAGAGALSAGANTTLRSTVFNGCRFFDTGAAITPAGNTTINVNDSSSELIAICAASLSPSGGAVATTRPIPFFTLLGLGT